MSAGLVVLLSVVLGVLEEPQCKRPPRIAVRALFADADDRWRVLNDRAAWNDLGLDDVTWTVAFDGKRRGQVRTIDPGFETELEWTFARDRLLSPSNLPPTTLMDNSGRRFGGWCDPPAKRPLVVVSRPNVRDPEGWKPFAPAATLRQRLFADVRARIGTALICPQGDDKPVPLVYGAADLLFSSSYSDRKGRMLVTTGLDPARNDCDGPPPLAWSGHSFVIDGAVRYLGADLTLVDAGDYDADGASELLFWYTSYNEDGYTLFYRGFEARADYWWSYH